MTRALSRIPEMLSKTDVADLLKVSVKTVERRIATGELQVHRIGNRIRISADDYRTFVAGQRQWTAENQTGVQKALSHRAAERRAQAK